MTEEILKTLARPSSARYTDRGSRFLAHAFPIMNLQEMEDVRTGVAARYPDATHHCYAWRFNPFQPEEFAQDDGEPAGTAGLPILGVIKAGHLVNVLIVVVRYYGGTKLGKPGLIHAYREAAALSITEAEKMSLDRFIPFSVSYPYDQENRIRELVNRFRMITEQESYLETVSMTLYCKAELAPQVAGILENLTHLGVTFTPELECFRPIDDDTQQT